MRTSFLRAFLLAACGLGFAGASARAAGPATFEITPDTLRADADGTWRATLRVHNAGEWGLYPDSLSLEWRRLDDEPSVAAREGTSSLTSLIHIIQPAGTGETTGLDWNAPADFERGTLQFRLYMHDAKKTPYALEKSVVVAGSDLYDRCQRALLDVAGGRKVEVVEVPAASVEGEAQGPTPALLYVPPAGVTARQTLRWANQHAMRGTAVGIVSLPGSGGSTGPSDRAGPASVAAVESALAWLAKQPGVDGKRVAVWGLGDGASTALLAAVKHPELQGVIAQNAEYDPWRAYRALSPADREAFVKAAGRDSASWRARAPGLVAQRITPAVLVLHNAGMGDDSRLAAEAFVAARAAKNLDTESRIEGAAGAPPAGRRDASRIANDFLVRRFRR
jgi:hypothetical protein